MEPVTPGQRPRPNSGHPHPHSPLVLGLEAYRCKPNHWTMERRAGFEPAAIRLCRPFPWSARAPAQGTAVYRRQASGRTRCERPGGRRRRLCGVATAAA